MSDDPVATAASIPYEGTDCTPEEAVEAVKAVRATAASDDTMPGPRRNDPREPVWASATVEVSLWDLHIVLSAAHGTFEDMRDLGTAYADDLEAFNRVNDAKNAAVEGVKGV